MDASSSDSLGTTGSFKYVLVREAQGFPPTSNQEFGDC